MNKSQLKSIIRECIQEVINEVSVPAQPVIAKYLGKSSPDSTTAAVAEILDSALNNADMSNDVYKALININKSAVNREDAQQQLKSLVQSLAKRIEKSPKFEVKRR